MTTLNIYESIKQIFPKLIEPQIIAEMNTAQDKFARRTHILRKVGDLKTITSKVLWDLPSDFVKLYKVELYDSNGKRIRKEDEQIDWFTDDKQLMFYDTSDTKKITSIPTSITYIWVRYSHLPTALSTVSTSLTIDSQFSEAVLAGALETLYGRIPTPILSQGNIITTINFNAVRYWANKFNEIKREALKWINSLDSSERRTRNYQHAGAVYLPSEAKDSNITPESWT